MALVMQTRRYVFQGVHRLPNLHESKHGHHFYLEVSFTGASSDLADQCYQEHVDRELHGRELSRLISPPTGENIVEWIAARLKKSALGPHLRGVVLQETDKNRYTSAESEACFV